VSAFLDEKYGFLPVAIPITEPAVGYGAAVGLMFISEPLGQARAAGFGRPDITLLGGLATENGTWGLIAADMRHWLDDRLQTQVGLTHLSANLDFHGIGQDRLLDRHPLRYNLEPTGGVVRVKYRLGETPLWAGLGYAFASTRITFDKPEGTPGRPNFERISNEASLTPSLTYDSRDNLFTPTRGTFAEAIVGVFSPALGGDDELQRVQLTGIHYLPLLGDVRRRALLPAPVHQPARGAHHALSGRGSGAGRGRAPLAVLEALQPGGIRRGGRGVERLRARAQPAGRADGRRGLPLRAGTQARHSRGPGLRRRPGQHRRVPSGRKRLGAALS
jgi:Outer membrane protein/protective antigen OMA87